jgi:hypothetical protein
MRARWQLGALLRKMSRGVGPERGKKASPAETSFTAELERIGRTYRMGERHSGHGDQKSALRRVTPTPELSDLGFTRPRAARWQLAGELPPANACFSRIPDVRKGHRLGWGQPKRLHHQIVRQGRGG